MVVDDFDGLEVAIKDLQKDRKLGENVTLSYLGKSKCGAITVLAQLIRVEAGEIP